MKTGFSKTIKLTAKNALHTASCNPRKLALIYGSVIAGITFIFTLINYLLSLQIGNTSGLAGMESLSVLTTIQSMLPLLTALFLPIWEACFLRVGMGFARNEKVGPNTLTAGLRRFGPLFRLLLLQAILLIVILFISSYISSFIFSLTPWAAPSQQMLAAIAETGTITEEAIMEIMPTILPLYGILIVIFAAIAIPFFYRLRLAEFIVLDTPAGALAAIAISRQLMRGKRFKLFCLDVSFWWFYLLQMLCSCIAYLDIILPLLGITLPISGDVAFFLFYILYLLCQLGLYWWAGSFVKTTYATALDSFIPKTPDIPDAPIVNM